ncbi:hypothetical protein BC834DRAFT_408473 [Gloeopeniophorella convolvens]|nr:hypothetical protein BC834DRAFT_408473 [Gloeopeniophorella convolvens]
MDRYRSDETGVGCLYWILVGVQHLLDGELVGPQAVEALRARADCTPSGETSDASQAGHVLLMDPRVCILWVSWMRSRVEWGTVYVSCMKRLRCPVSRATAVGSRPACVNTREEPNLHVSPKVVLISS